MDSEYRGLTKDGQWEYGGINEKGTMIVRGFMFLLVQQETIGRNTRCRDVGGTYAFEGDVVLPTEDSNIPRTLKTVVYDSAHARFMLKSADTFYGLEDGKFEILGNIYTGGGDIG